MAPTKVFVGSLPPGTKPEELRHLFEDYGIVVECDVMNRCGFVHMENAAMAENAILALNSTDFKGQSIVVEHGRPKERAIGGVPNHGSGGGGPVGRPQRGGRGGPGGGNVGGLGRGAIVGFPGNMQHVNKQVKEAATLQLAGVIMELLNDNQSENQNIPGGNMGGGRGGYMRGGGANGPMGGGRGGGGMGRGGGNFQGGRGSGQHNMNGPGPIRNQGFKPDRTTPYPQQNMNMAGPSHSGVPGSKFNHNNNRGGGNFNNHHRGGNFLQDNNVGDNNSWNNSERIPNRGPTRGGYQGQQGRGGGGYNDNNFSGGFSGNMSNVPSGNYGGQDRRGFTLPSNQPPKYGGGGSGGGSGYGGNNGGGYNSEDVPYAGDDVGFGGDDDLFQRRNNSAPHMGARGNTGGGVNFNRGANRGNRGGNFNNNRGGLGSGGPQQSGFKKNYSGNNFNDQDSYQQQFPPLGVGKDGPQTDFGNNRGGFNRGGGGGFNRGGGGGFNRGGGTGMGRGGGGGGISGRGGFGGGGGMNRNAPRQNMPNRRY